MNAAKTSREMAIYTSDWWESAVDGLPLPRLVDQPHAGYYKLRNRNKRWYPVQIWLERTSARDLFQAFARVGFHDGRTGLPRLNAGEIWPWADPVTMSEFVRRAQEIDHSDRSLPSPDSFLFDRRFGQ